MSTRTKEEELALDEKIARIQRKNEEILRRQKEIEEDKRIAEQQNAVVKLRPSTKNVSRDRTPALKPSNRELRHDVTEEDFTLQEPLPMRERPSRGSFRGRGGERVRGQGDWKVSGGPPPDPRSFLYDDERDYHPTDNKEPERARERRDERDVRDNRDNFRGGGREFQRGRRRGGSEYRGERGRRGGGRRNEEEAWRAERMKIDEARIQRQRAADGKWRREWDSDKLLQEQHEEPRHEARKFNLSYQEKHSPPNQGRFHSSPDGLGHHLSRGGMASRGGRGRGRLDPLELEMPLEKFHVEMLPSKTSPVGGFTQEDNTLRPLLGAGVVSPPSPHSSLDPTRSVECVGNSVKISIPNKGAAQSTPKPQRQFQETRGRYKSQTSYSSQSDDDSPRDRRGNHSGRRQRSQKSTLSTKGQDKNQAHITLDKTSLETLPVQNKPPLPPFRAEQKPLAGVKESIKAKDGDESWEDVTTSGTESIGEDISSVNSSPLRKTIIVSGKQKETMTAESIQTVEFLQNQPLDEDVKNRYEEYLKKLEMNEAQNSLGGSSIGYPELIRDTDTSSSSVNISLDTSDNILLAGFKSEELLIDRSGSECPSTVSGGLKCTGFEETIDSIQKDETILEPSDNILLAGISSEEPLIDRSGLEGGASIAYPELLQGINTSSSCVNISFDTSDNILLAGLNSEELIDNGLECSTTVSDGLKSPRFEGIVDIIPKQETVIGTSDNILLAGINSEKLTIDHSEFECSTTVADGLKCPGLEETIDSIQKDETILEPSDNILLAGISSEEPLIDRSGLECGASIAYPQLLQGIDTSSSVNISLDTTNNIVQAGINSGELVIDQDGLQRLTPVSQDLIHPGSEDIIDNIPNDETPTEDENTLKLAGKGKTPAPELNLESSSNLAMNEKVTDEKKES